MKKLLLILLISFISSQDVSNEEICLPREQIQALFLDAQQLPLVESKLALKDSIIMSNNEVFICISCFRNRYRNKKHN